MTQKQRRSKARDTRPARARYWSTRKLQKRKILRIMKSMNITREEALLLWLKSREGRRMPSNAAERKV